MGYVFLGRFIGMVTFLVFAHQRFLAKYLSLLKLLNLLLILVHVNLSFRYHIKIIRLIPLPRDHCTHLTKILELHHICKDISLVLRQTLPPTVFIDILSFSLVFQGLDMRYHLPVMVSGYSVEFALGFRFDGRCSLCVVQ